MAQQLIVDWEKVKKELNETENSWKEPRFDSLAHVVEVLTSPNPEEATRLLREQRDVIEALVDDVVRGYHKGFNKAIHNYSQILKLFSDSASSVSTLKNQLSECKQLLGTRHKQLQQQWYRSITLRHVITLLDQIDHVSQVPVRIEHLMAEKKFYAAVQLHIQSIAMLEREGIQGVGALQGVRADLSKLQGTLFNKVVEDLHLHLYGKGEFSPTLLRTQDADEDLSSIENSIPSSTSLHPVSRRTRSFRTQGSDASDADRRKSSMNGGSSLPDGEDSSQSGDFESETASTSKSFVRSRQVPSWLAEATPNEFVEGITKSGAPVNVKYLQTMIECLNLLEKTAAAGAILSQRLRPTVHELIVDEVKNQAASIEASRPRVEAKLTYGYRNGASLPSLKKEHSATFSISETSPSMGPNGPAQAPARQLLQSVLDILACVLENHVVVSKAIGNKEDDSRSAGGYNLGLVFTVSQNECQQLIGDILQVNPDSTTKEAPVQTARPAAYSNGNAETGLTFSFRFADTASMTIPDRSRRRGSSGAPEGFWTGSVLSERGIYLIAALYRPTIEFSDKMASILPETCTHLAKEGLQSFIESFIKDQFLPMIAVDYRTKAADALASTAAFRPKPQSSYETREKGAERAPIALLGPFIADKLANEVVSWARAMPKYAAEFLELVQTILERTLERCRAVFTEAVLGTLSSSFIGRTDVEKLMAQESAANSLVDGDAQTAVPNDEDMEVEMEMNNLLLSLRPVRKEQLLKDDQKCVLLAALSESLDSLSVSIKRLSSSKREQKKVGSALILGLQELSRKYHELSLECLRTLRVEMQLQAIFHLQSMTHRVYVSDQDAEEPEDFIVSFTTQIARWDEEMAHYISCGKRNYVFGGICGVSATAFIKALSDMSLVNVFGVRQICRNCIALQQALAALSSSSGDVVQQRLDRVRTYYELLTMPFEALMAFVAEHQTEFSFHEFSSLLQVNVPGREIPQDAFQRIGRILAP